MNERPDLFDSADQEWDDQAAAEQIPDEQKPTEYFKHQIRHMGTHTEQVKCRACGGSGKFYSKFSGRYVGDCYRCKGTGRTTAKVEKIVATRQANQYKRDEERHQWCMDHADVIKWLKDNEGRSGFAKSVLNQYYDHKVLSDPQVRCVRRNIAEEAARATQNALRTLPKTTDPGTGLDLSGLPEGRYAVPGGDSRLKVLVQKPQPPSKWAGWVFVKDAAEYGEGRRYGKQPPGGEYVGEIVSALKAILQDPKAACAAYGKLVGRCGICGRHLEDADSVARGIGPICAAKF